MIGFAVLARMKAAAEATCELCELCGLPVQPFVANSTIGPILGAGMCDACRSLPLLAVIEAPRMKLWR